MPKFISTKEVKRLFIFRTKKTISNNLKGVKDQ